MDISLALGGGGSRGYAHIGVIRRLEKEGFRIRAVAGTSAGGIVAALYAAGFSPDEMENHFEELDQSKLFTITLNEGPALLSISYATRILEKYLGEREFESLKIPCALVAVDLRSHREVILNKGRVVDAVLATTAVPGVFPPRVLGEYELVDGGVLNPVPVGIARSLMKYLPVAAVVLSPEMEAPVNLVHLSLPVRIPTPIVDRLTRMRLAQAFKIFEESVELGQRMITALRLEVDEPEVVIRPEVGMIGLLEKTDIRAAVALGEKAVEAVLPDLLRETSWSRRMGRGIFIPRKRGRREIPVR